MVCKNCGADLKPGIKYCLECGNYIDDEDDEYYDESGELSTDYKPVSLREGGRRRKKRLSLTLSDYLIYAGLFIVMIGSIIVIIVALVKQNQQPVQQTPPIVEEQDKKYSIGNYVVTVPGGKIVSTQQGTTLYVSDNTNYTFSYQNTLDNFDMYVDDRTLLEKQLTDNKYEVLSNTDRTVNNRLFLIYEIKVNGVNKVLYLTKANSQYTTMGIIEKLTNDHWDEALPVIDVINNSISFDTAE